MNRRGERQSQFDKTGQPLLSADKRESAGDADFSSLQYDQNTVASDRALSKQSTKHLIENDEDQRYKMNEVSKDLLHKLISDWSDGIIKINELFLKIAEYKLSLSMLEFSILNKIADALI